MRFNIGITGTGSLIGQAVIKSIVRSENPDSYRLIGFDYFTQTVGSFSCAYNYILPDLLDKKVSTVEWLDTLLKHIKTEKISILFVGVDFELPLLAKHKKEFKKIDCSVVISSEEVINISSDKYLTYKFLKDNHLNCPISYLPHEDIENISYPVIIKPREGARSRDVYKVDSYKELSEKIPLITNPVIQEYVGDDLTEYTCGILFMDGELQSSICLKRSIKEGNTFIAEHDRNTSENINTYISKVAYSLKPYGSINLQLRLDRNGDPKIFEINPRHSGTTYMRSLFGYNEVLFILKYILENKKIKFDLKYGKVLRFYEEQVIQ